MLRTVAGVALGLIGSLLAAEAAFRVLPVGTATLTGYYIDPAILTYPPHHTWRAASGWDLRNAQTLKSNNLGFASERDYVPNPTAVGLIGDSFVESSMLPAEARPGPQLEEQLGGARAVYALGGPGSSLLDYAERIRYAHQVLQVRDFVVLMEAGDVRQALCGSGNVHSACLDRKTLSSRTETQPKPTLLKRWLRHSALAQYLAGQLRVDATRLVRKAFVRSVPEHPGVRAATVVNQAALSSADEQAIDAVTRAFFERTSPYLRDGRLIVVVDGLRPGTPPVEQKLALERTRFISAARAAGAVVVDVEPRYAEHAKRSRLSLAVGPHDGHLNRLGVSIAMAAAAEPLK